MALMATIFPKDLSSKIWQWIAAAAVSCNCHKRTLSQECQHRISRQTRPKVKYLKAFLCWINMRSATSSAPQPRWDKVLLQRYKKPVITVWEKRARWLNSLQWGSSSRTGGWPPALSCFSAAWLTANARRKHRHHKKQSLTMKNLYIFFSVRRKALQKLKAHKGFLCFSDLSGLMLHNSQQQPNINNVRYNNSNLSKNLMMCPRSVSGQRACQSKLHEEIWLYYEFSVFHPN